MKISYAFQQCKNFENRLKFDKVAESLKVGIFFEKQCISVPNLTKISSFTTKIWPKIEIQDGGRRHVKFWQKGDIELQ